MLEALVGVLAGEAERAEVDQREMRVGAAGDQVGAALLEAVGERLGVLDHRLGIGLEARLERLAERHRLGGDDVHQRAALEAREDRRVDLLGDRLVIGQHHAAARAAQRLVGGGGDDMGVAERRRMLARRDQPGEMGHVDKQIGADLVAMARKRAKSMCRG